MRAEASAGRNLVLPRRKARRIVRVASHLDPNGQVRPSDNPWSPKVHRITLALMLPQKAHPRAKRITIQVDVSMLDRRARGRHEARRIPSLKATVAECVLERQTQKLERGRDADL